MEIMVPRPVPRVRSKIIATVGPACQDPETLRDLIDRGVDVFRVNMAHGNREEHERVVANIRRVSDEAGEPIGILVDLAGPKIRLGQLFSDPTECIEGSYFRFIRGDQSQRVDELVSNYGPLVDELSVGDQVMLADGTVGMTVTEADANSAKCQVVAGGTVRSRQGVNLPGVKLSVPGLTEADRDNAVWAAEAGADFVSLSFVRSPDDVNELRELLASSGSQAFVIAKAEKREALERLDEIVLAADGVMVARGDLGVEIDVAETPVAQKRIIATCHAFSKPVIVATQMLDSMHHSKRPTRAEASDVANAILDGADACMLSGETAIGEYPRETVNMMNQIMIATERMLHRVPPASLEQPVSAGIHPVTAAVVAGAAHIANQLFAKLVVISTRTGNTARVHAKQRCMTPAVGVSDSDTALRQMNLFWGITPLPGAPLDNPQLLREFVMEWGQSQGLVSPGDNVVFLTGTGLVDGMHNSVEVLRT
jgi:pyruvate kinase